MRWISVGAIAAIVLLVAVAGLRHVSAQDETRSGSVVNVKARVEHTGPGKDVVVVDFDVRNTYHLYANPVGDQDFESQMTRIQVMTKGAAKVDVDYPPGKERDFAGLKLKIYEGTFQIRATVERDVKCAAPLEVNVRFQAVDDKSCLLPDVKRFTLP
jgi:Disulphide bond corrector protein DsbC